MVIIMKLGISKDDAEQFWMGAKVNTKRLEQG